MIVMTQAAQVHITKRAALLALTGAAGAALTAGPALASSNEWTALRDRYWMLSDLVDHLSEAGCGNQSAHRPGTPGYNLTLAIDAIEAYRPRTAQEFMEKAQIVLFESGEYYAGAIIEKRPLHRLYDDAARLTGKGVL